MVIDNENTHLNQVIRVTAGANREREVKKPRIRLVANMHGDYDFDYDHNHTMTVIVSWPFCTIY